MNEKLYLFNPWNIKEWENEAIKQQFDILITAYNCDASTPYEFASNIENLANQEYLIGEMIARLNEDTLLLKNEVDSMESKQIYIQRKQWQETNADKPPAMSYFEAMASDYVKEDRVKYAKKKSDLERFKRAYDSIENKMNAVKKKMEAVKYEEFGG